MSILTADSVAQLVIAPDCVRDAQTAQDQASAAHFFQMLIKNFFFNFQKLSITIGTMFRW